MHDTVAIDSHLLHWRMVLEEVEVQEGNLLGAGVLDDGLDLGVADLTQSNVQSRCLIGAGGQGRDILGQG